MSNWGLIGDPATPSGSSRLSEQEAIHGLKRLGRLVSLICVLFLFNANLGFVSALYIKLTATEWFVDWHTFIVALSIMIGITTWPLSFWAFKRNIVGSTYGIFFGVVGILIITFLALVVWGLVEWFLFCPNDMPDICTDTVTTTIEMGWLLFMSYAIIQLILFAVSFAIMYSVRRYYRSLVSNLGGTTQERVVQMIYEAMFGNTPAYVTGIGMQQY